MSKSTNAAQSLPSTYHTNKELLPDTYERGGKGCIHSKDNKSCDCYEGQHNSWNSPVSQTQHLITKIQQICQEIHDIKRNRTFQKPQQTFIKPQTSPNPPLCHHNHSNKTLCSNTPSSPKEGEPALKTESSPQIITNSPNSMPKVSPQAPQNHPGHPMPENPNLEKSVHNIETTSSIDL